MLKIVASSLDASLNHPQIVLSKHVFSLGRLPEMDANLRIDTETGIISREHATFRYKDGEGWTVSDSSMNGVFVNGKRCAAKAATALKEGDKICFGLSGGKDLLSYTFHEKSTETSALKKRKESESGGDAGSESGDDEPDKKAWGSNTIRMQKGDEYWQVSFRGENSRIQMGKKGGKETSESRGHGTQAKAIQFALGKVTDMERVGFKIVHKGPGYADPPAEEKKTTKREGRKKKEAPLTPPKASDMDDDNVEDDPDYSVKTRKDGVATHAAGIDAFAKKRRVERTTRADILGVTDPSPVPPPPAASSSSSSTTTTTVSSASSSSEGIVLTSATASASAASSAAKIHKKCSLHRSSGGTNQVWEAIVVGSVAKIKFGRKGQELVCIETPFTSTADAVNHVTTLENRKKKQGFAEK